MLRKIKKLSAVSRPLSANKLLLSILSGIFAALPFCDGRLWICAWFGFVPLFFALRNKSRFQSFLLSYLCGIAFWLITIYWLIHVTLPGQILLILYLSLYFGFFGLFVSRPSSLVPRLGLLFIPSLWVLLEYLRAHLLSGFGWALLGYSQYLNLPIIQIADVFGAYGVSFVVMMGNVGIYSVIGYRLSVIAKRQQWLLSITCVFIALGYGYYKMLRTPNTEYRIPLKISLIQGNIPQELKWAIGSEPLILDRYSRLTEEAALDKPDLILWPEASSPGFIGDSEDAWISESIFALAKKTKTPLLFGTVVKEHEKYFNSALLIDGNGKLAGRYDKLHLVPFGEYIPLKHIFKFLATIVPIGDFTPGKEYNLFKLSAIRYPLSAKFAVLICFEDTIPELARSFVEKGAEFLVNITNDAWFGNTSASYQHLSASVFRAVENRVPLVRVANTGVSCVIDAQGKITARVSQNGRDIFIPGIKTENILLHKGNSIYRNRGDIVAAACLVLAGFCGIIKQKLAMKS